MPERTATARKVDRLDKAIASLFPDISRSAAQRWIDEDRVRVNGASLDAASRVKPGDAILINVPEVLDTVPRAEAIALSVLFEDRDVIAINKPSGLVVHPGAGNPTGTVVNAILARAPEVADVGDLDRPGIVHRLDKETSGVLLIAKTPEAYRALQGQFKTRTIHKTYLALCVGSVTPDRGRINKPIARDPSNRQRMAVIAGGREAVTEYAVTEVFRLAEATEVLGAALHAGSCYSLVRAHPETGRTHQLRVHLASIGYPIVGDEVYGATRHDALSQALAPRQLLHASELRFELPATGEPIRLHAPLPPDMAEVVHALGG